MMEFHRQHHHHLSPKSGSGGKDHEKRSFQKGKANSRGKQRNEMEGSQLAQIAKPNAKENIRANGNRKSCIENI